jgi:ribonuclease P/MRP protein subunit RPP1
MSFYECNLHALPEGSDSISRLAFISKRLGYDGIIISNHTGFDALFRPNAALRIKNIDVALGIEVVANSPEKLRNCVSNLRARYPFIAVHGGFESINRAACEDPNVDVLLHPEEGRQALGIAAARSAEQNQVAIGFDLSPLIQLRGLPRIRWLGTLRRNIILARKLDLSIMITTGGKSHFDLRSPKDLMALAQLVGLEPVEAEEALRLPARILELNRKLWLSPGVELL